MDIQYVRHLASFCPQSGISGSNVLEIPDTGHLLMVEQPNLVSSKILDILQGS